MELQFAEVLNLLLVGVVLIQSGFLARSIPRETWDNFWSLAGEAVSKTPNTTDDKIVAGGRNILTPILERYNLIKSTPIADSPSAPVEPPAQG
jgi:hypothetical protein